MAISKAQQRATAKYVSKTYDRIEIKVPKGKKQIIQSCAESQGESLNGYISKAVYDRMGRDRVGGADHEQP